MVAHTPYYDASNPYGSSGAQGIVKQMSYQASVPLGKSDMQHASVVRTLEGVAAAYPPAMVAAQQQDIQRVAFHIQAALEVAPRRPLNELSICDIGGGIGLFSVGCAALGFRKVVLIDDFGDQVNLAVGDPILELHQRYGVVVHSSDVLDSGVAELADGMEVVTSFDSMEHWHHSPKRLFHQLIDHLPDGGGFLLGVPNSVNLRKRLSVPFGVGCWSSIQDWYEPVRFRGHVREPNVADLRYIAHDLGLEDVQVFGRNWLGHNSASRTTRWFAKLFDVPLRTFSSLCSDIYLSGKKPCAV